MQTSSFETLRSRILSRDVEMGYNVELYAEMKRKMAIMSEDQRSIIRTLYDLTPELQSRKFLNYIEGRVDEMKITSGNHVRQLLTTTDGQETLRESMKELKRFLPVLRDIPNSTPQKFLLDRLRTTIEPMYELLDQLLGKLDLVSRVMGMLDGGEFELTGNRYDSTNNDYFMGRYYEKFPEHRKDNSPTIYRILSSLVYLKEPSIYMSDRRITGVYDAVPVTVGLYTKSYRIPKKTITKKSVATLNSTISARYRLNGSTLSRIQRAADIICEYYHDCKTISNDLDKITRQVNSLTSFKDQITYLLSGSEWTAEEISPSEIMFAAILLGVNAPRGRLAISLDTNHERFRPISKYSI